MKANQAFRAREDAVSPVLGAILSVAIVIALAVAVWFMIRLLTKSSDATPAVAFTKDGPVLQVATAPSPPLDWFTDIRPSGTCAANLQLTPNGGTAGAYPIAAGTPVTGGDKLTGCTAGQTLTLSHVATNRVIFQASF